MGADAGVLVAMLILSPKPKQTLRRLCVRTGQESDRLRHQMCPKKRRIRLPLRAKTSGMSPREECGMPRLLKKSASRRLAESLRTRGQDSQLSVGDNIL